LSHFITVSSTFFCYLNNLSLAAPQQDVSHYALMEMMWHRTQGAEEVKKVRHLVYDMICLHNRLYCGIDLQWGIDNQPWF